jgi:hypothetical protein
MLSPALNCKLYGLSLPISYIYGREKKQNFWLMSFVKKIFDSLHPKKRLKDTECPIKYDWEIDSEQYFIL